MPAGKPRRFLIASGTQHYLDSRELPSVPDDLRRIVEFFTKFQYGEALGDLRLDPTTDKLRTSLSQWFISEDRDPADTVVIYYSGHGDIHAGIHYLLTADTRAGQYPASALHADYPLEILGEDPLVRRVLLIVDACFAGAGAFDTALLAARMSAHQRWAYGEGVWVVVASSSWQEAEEGVFSSAFIEAAAELQRDAGRLQRYLALDELIDRVNAILERRAEPQLVRQMPVTGATGVAPFIPNLHYAPDVPANVDLDTAASWLRHRRAAELAGHWDPKSRGVEVAVQAGDYFTGRDEALGALTGWLADPGTDSRIRIVTGGPGAGKSAVLGRLVTLANAGPPVQGVSALLAKGKTAAELLDELAATPGLGQPDELAGGRLHRIVIDALDEASDPPSVVEKVILPLQAAASAGAGPRLTIGTRPNPGLLSLLPRDRVVVDLDAEPYSEPGDVAKYVEKILLAAELVDPGSGLRYRDLPATASAVADTIAEIAGHSFLIAQIAARNLARTPQVMNPAEVAAARDRWSDVGAAFDQDLARYGADAYRIRALLTALAWAEGAGLPRELWAPLATALDEPRVYTNDDVAFVLAEAGAYIVEALDSERSVYRLYHQEFARHLRAGQSSAEAGRRAAVLFGQRVPADPAGRPQWMAATPYIRTHLAAHAAAGGLLDELLTDPGFLLATAPDRLVPVLGSARRTEARRAGEAFRRARPWLSAGPGQLLLAALQVGAERLAAEIRAAALPVPGQWSAAWAWWLRPTPALTITTFDARSASTIGVTHTEVGAIAVVTVAGRLESWDLDRGALLATRSAPAMINCGAMCDFAGTPAIAVGDEEGRLTILSVPGLDQLAGFAEAHPAAIRTMAAADGYGILVSGDKEGGLATWALPDLRRLGQRTDAHTDVRQLATVTNGGELFVISAGDSAPVAAGRARGMPTLRMWAGPDLRPVASWPHRTGLVGMIGVLSTAGQVAVLVNTSSAETETVTAELWVPDVASGRFTRAGQLPGVEFDELIRLSDDDYLISTDDTLIPLSAPQPVTEPVTLGRPVETEFADWAGPVATSQGDALVSTTGALRLWALRDLSEESARQSERPRRQQFIVTSLAASDGLVCTSTVDGGVRAWDAGTGESAQLEVSPKTSVSVIGLVSESREVILGLETGELQLWDRHRRRPRWRVKAGEKIIAVKTLPLGERMIVLAAVQLSWELYVCRMWDVRTGREIASRNRSVPDELWFRGYQWNLAVPGYRRDKPVTGLAVAETPDGPLAAVASRATMIPVWSLTSQEQVAELRLDGASAAMVLTFVSGRLFAGGTDGELLGWRQSAWWTARREPPAWATHPMNDDDYPGEHRPDIHIPRAHYGPVQAIAGGTWSGQPCVVTGGRDGRLHAWTVRGERLATADLGAAVTALVSAGPGRYAVGTERGLVLMESGTERGLVPTESA